MLFDRKVQVPVLVFALLGCGANGGIFRKDGFYNERHPYRVSYPQANGLLTRNGWVVDNYERDGQEFGDEKTSARYRAFAHIDRDEDGIADAALAFPAYDLLLRNTRHAGRIWIRTLPLPPELQRTELRVLALDFIDAVGATGRITSEVSSDPLYDKRRLVTRVIDGYNATLDGERAYEVTFDSADTDQVRFGDKDRYQRTRMIVLRPDFDYLFGRRQEHFPLLMLVGYSNRVEDFPRGNADFEQLVSGIDFLTESELVQTRAAALFECAEDHARELTVYVDVDERGYVTWADTQSQPKFTFEGRPRTTCIYRAIDDLRLRDKGQAHRLTVKLERDQSSLLARGYERIQQWPITAARLQRQRIASRSAQPLHVADQVPAVTTVAAPAPAAPAPAVIAAPAPVTAPAMLLIPAAPVTPPAATVPAAVAAPAVAAVPAPAAAAPVVAAPAPVAVAAPVAAPAAAPPAAPAAAAPPAAAPAPAPQ